MEGFGIHIVIPANNFVMNEFDVASYDAEDLDLEKRKKWIHSRSLGRMMASVLKESPMPTAALRPCRVCKVVGCPAHAKKADWDHGSPRKRIRGPRLQRLRAALFADDPFCANVAGAWQAFATISSHSRRAGLRIPAIFRASVPRATGSNLNRKRRAAQRHTVGPK